MHNKRKETLPRQARKARTIIKARQFILYSELERLPIDPCTLYETYGWHLHTWDAARDIIGEDDPFYIKAAKAEAKTVATPCNSFLQSMIPALSRTLGLGGLSLMKLDT